MFLSVLHASPFSLSLYRSLSVSLFRSRSLSSFLRNAVLHGAVRYDAIRCLCYSPSFSTPYSTRILRERNNGKIFKFIGKSCSYVAVRCILNFSAIYSYFCFKELGKGCKIRIGRVHVYAFDSFAFALFSVLFAFFLLVFARLNMNK